MVEISYSNSKGKGKVVGQSNSSTKTKGTNTTTGSSTSYTASQSKALGHSVSESYNEIASQSRSNSKSSTCGNTEGESKSQGASYYHPVGTEDIRFSDSTVISASHTNSTGVGLSESSGISSGRTNGTADSETNTTAQSKMTGNNESYGISRSTAETVGAMESFNQHESFGTTVRRMSIGEEEALIAQSIRALQPREIFISMGSIITRAITLDSITIKLKNQLAPYLNDYYQQLEFYQNSDRIRYTLRPEPKGCCVEKKPDTQKKSHKSKGMDALF